MASTFKMSQPSASNLKNAKDNVSAEDSANTPSDNDDHPIPELVALPDVPLQRIVSYIPIQSQITTIPLIHPRLSTFREIALRQNRHLILHIGDREEIAQLKRWAFYRGYFTRHLIDLTTGKPLYPESTPFHHLHLDSLEISTVYMLNKHMPDISHLQIFMYSSDILHIHNLFHLLTPWSSTLRSLKLHTKFSREGSTPKELSLTKYLLLRLIDFINSSLPYLVHLTLDFDDCLFEEDEETPTLAMPILGRLREFYMITPDYPEFIVETLRTYATESLEKVGLGVASSWDSLLEAFPEGTHLASTIVYLPPYIIPIAEAIFEARFFPTFTSLRELTLDLYKSRPLTSLPALLAPLHQLTSLQLTVRNPDFHSLTNDVPNWRNLPPLGSVQILKINLLEDAPNHQDTVSPLWVHLFPSVQILLLYHCPIEFCTRCHPEWEKDEPITKETIDTALPCIKQYLAPLTVLPKLRKMFYSRLGQDPFAEFTSAGDFVQTVDNPE